ncbi:hypothetical protein EV421DRAFT_1720716, partial [Armillaria borealis]
CLMENHSVETAGDAQDITARLTEDNHERTTNCYCMACDYDREVLHCDALNLCAVVAKKLLNRLTAKWDSRQEPANDRLRMMEEDRANNRTVWEENERVIFDPTIDDTNDLSDTFQIFTGKGHTCPVPARRITRPDTVEEEEEDIAYTDGSAESSGTTAVRAGAGVWYAKDNERNLAIQLKGLKQTNNAGESQAVLERIINADKRALLLTLSDSKYVIGGLCIHLRAWEDRGWIGIPNKEVLQAIVARM